MNMQCKRLACLLLIALLGIAAVSSGASAQLVINEIYFDPPGSSGDNFSEYIELRGTPNLSLENHYLVFIENESSLTANAGLIDALFDLSGNALGSNGYLTIRQAGNFYGSVAPGTTDLVNSGSRFGRGNLAPSTVGFSDLGDDGKLENSGFTAMLIDTGAGAAPALGQDLDVGDDGFTGPIVDLFPAGWSVVDSIGVISEISETSGRLYGEVNYSVGTPAGGPAIEPGATFVDVGGFEIEYIGRWGESTGSAAGDWHASNLTNDFLSGYTGGGDYRQSGEPHGTAPNFPPGQFVESNQGVAYGTRVTNTLGATNYYVLDGDFEMTRDANQDALFDGDVDGGDFLVWQRNFGMGDGNDGARQYGDANLDRVVDGADLAIWAANYGTSLNSSPLVAAAASVPEPSSLLLLSVACLVAGVRRR
jgi:hypothetical protein